MGPFETFHRAVIKRHLFILDDQASALTLEDINNASELAWRKLTAQQQRILTNLFAELSTVQGVIEKERKP